MEIIKILYFAMLGILILQSTVRRKIKLNWLIIVFVVSLHSFYFFGWQGIAFILITAVISTIAELISLKTPVNVFGMKYRYKLTHNAFPSRIIISHVYPIEVTAAWVFLKYLSFFLVQIIVYPFGVPGIIQNVLSAIVLVSFDLLIDPYAVYKGAWTWEKPGKFFGIPWQNFFGWFLVGIVISLLFYSLKPLQMNDISMIIPLLIICLIFPATIGRKVYSLNKPLGLLANLPLVLFISLAVYSFLYQLLIP